MNGSWSKRRLKHFLRLNYGDALSANARSEGEVLVYGSNGSVGLHDAPNTLAPAIIVGRKGSHGKVTWASNAGFCIDTAYFVDARHCSGHLRFAYYLLQSLELDRNTRDTGVPGLERSEAHNRGILQPDLATQRQIADFLDRETARIDLLIEKKQRFSSGVEDEFQDRVSHLVTFGAHNDAPQKHSGYSWHPTVPAHWTVTRLKFLCSRIVDCLHETPEHIEDGDYPSIRTSDLIRGSVDIGAAKRVSADEYRHRIQRLEPKDGDILYTREGERFGLAALVPPETKLCLGQRMMMFRTNRRVLPAYLMWSLNGKFAYNFLKQDVTGATSPHLNIFDIRNVPVFLPPIDEQRALVTKIDAFFEKKSQLVEKTLATIDRLKEYRSALITAAVTGQIDVATHSKSGSTDRRLDAIQEEMQA